MEVQAHGNHYEDLKIRELTGLGKKEYDKLKKNGYTSVFDISKGLHSDIDISIKTAKSGAEICTGDIRRMRTHSEYDIIIAQWEQVTPTKKVFHTEYRFHIKPEHEKLLWGTKTYEEIDEYASKVNSVDYKNPAEVEAYRTPEKRDAWLEELAWDDNTIMKPRPKVNKAQARVQCAVTIDNLVNSGVEYSVTPIRIVVDSKPRTFNK